MPKTRVRCPRGGAAAAAPRGGLTSLRGVVVDEETAVDGQEGLLDIAAADDVVPLEPKNHRLVLHRHGAERCARVYGQRGAVKGRAMQRGRALLAHLRAAGGMKSSANWTAGRGSLAERDFL
jgi:hypothetical protein